MAASYQKERDTWALIAQKKTGASPQRARGPGGSGDDRNGMSEGEYEAQYRKVQVGTILLVFLWHTQDLLLMLA